MFRKRNTAIFPEKSQFEQDMADAIYAEKWDDVFLLAQHFFRMSKEERVNETGVLALLLSVKVGRSMFMGCEQWRNDVTQKELNKVTRYGVSPLYFLVKTEFGRKIIDDDASLRSKITEEGFNHTNDATLSPAYFFLHWDDAPDLLIKHAHLRYCLSKKTLNVPRSNSGCPSVYELAKSEKGIKILSDPAVLAKIDSKGLNFRGAAIRSTLAWLSLKDSGLALFLNEEVCLAKLVKKKEFNTVDQDGHSPALSFSQSKTGIKALLANPQLRDLYTADSLNRMTAENRSVVYYLCKSGELGVSLLASDRHLRKRITPECFNATASAGPHKGASPVYWLLASPAGRDLMARSKTLQNMIDPNILSVEVSSQDESCNSVLKQLVKLENFPILEMLHPTIQALVVARQDVVEKNYEISLTENGRLMVGRKSSPHVHEEMNNKHVTFKY